MELYCDTVWADGGDQKLISAYIVLLAGGTISWRAKKQSTVASSSIEAEYMAVLEATKESIWVQRLLSELEQTTIGNANIIFEDNQGAIALAYNPEYHASTKHIDIQYHFIRDCVENGKVKLDYCLTANMVGRCTHETSVKGQASGDDGENGFGRSGINRRIRSSVEKWECWNVSNFRLSSTKIMRILVMMTQGHTDDESFLFLLLDRFNFKAGKRI